VKVCFSGKQTLQNWSFIQILTGLRKKVVRIFGQKVREISDDFDRMTKNKGRQNFGAKVKF
jgi:hypothetical protein